MLLRALARAIHSTTGVIPSEATLAVPVDLTAIQELFLRDTVGIEPMLVPIRTSIAGKLTPDCSVLCTIPDTIEYIMPILLLLDYPRPPFDITTVTQTVLESAEFTDYLQRCAACIGAE